MARFLRSGRSVLVILGGAVLINIGLLGLAPLISQERGLPEDDTPALAVSLVSLAPPEPPAQEQVKEPAKPEPAVKSDFMPELVRPSLLGAAGIDPGVVVNLGDLDGTGDIGGEFVFEAYELDTPPQPVVAPPPVFPYKAREQGIEGVVQVKLLVRADGTVGRVMIMAARPEGLFEESVLKTVPQWRFKPGVVDGQEVTSWVVRAIRFEL